MEQSKYGARLFQSKSVSEVYLLKRRPLCTIAYAYPYIMFYAIWLALKLFVFSPVEEGELDYAMLLMILIVGGHSLTYLSCTWSPKVSKFIEYYEVNSPEKAETLMVVPKKHYGNTLFCNMVRNVPQTKNGKKEVILSVMYQNRKYIYNPDKKVFEKIRYPDQQIYNIKELENYSGPKISFNELKHTYGNNVCEIPSRTFIDLFMEHTLSPMFVFQIFSIMLWMLDGMIKYSLHVLFALLIFESITVTQRLKTVKEFQSMTAKPHDVQVFRDEKWTTIISTNLMPHDLILITSDHIDKALTSDMILINGSCLLDEAIMTGESTPQVREGVLFSPTSTHVSPKECPFSMMYAGTTLLQVSPPTDKSGIESSPSKDGVKAIVVRTGFATKQGKLIKKIIYNNDKISVSNTESLLFMTLLLFFAIIASIYVWIQGNKDETRNKSAILLDCVLIIVSAVPPELPTEISLSVNNSLTALSKNFIFCMEPFRIPFAGKIDVACFDKTGTLTQSDLVMEGIVLAGSKEIAPIESLDLLHKKLLASAHSIVMIGDKDIGDPMEKNTLKYISWKVSHNNVVYPKVNAHNQPGTENDGLTILRKFQFSSALKRMSTICAMMSDINSSSSSLTSSEKKITTFVSCKGAPETLEEMLIEKPHNYAELYKYWVKKGRRVLTFAYKEIILDCVPHRLEKDVSLIKREDAEKDLIFAGMLVFSCPLKPDAKSSIEKIIKSSHRVTVITGDNVFTACHVAKELEIVTNNVIIADVWKNGEPPSWKTIDEETELPIDPMETSINKKLDDYDMCISGKALKILHNKPWMHAYCPRIWVYARISPSQKEDIMIALKLRGYTTMMCGDGTNDMGALKSSHVGVAILNGDFYAMEKARERNAIMKTIKSLEQRENVRASMGLTQPDPKIIAKLEKLRNNAGIKPGVSLIETEKKLNKKSAVTGVPITADALMGELFDSFDDDAVNIRPGDASVAAPFTSKASCLGNIVKVLCQGRATLVAILQTYKILALNCIVSAYTISSLSLSGVRQSDIQSTIAGIVTTSCFFGISKSKLLENLSKQRPQSKAFGPYVLTSIIGQAAIHVLAFIYIRKKALEYTDDNIEEDYIQNDDFYPNLLNTSIYLISVVTQISTFVVNYQGHPFRQDIRSNKPLWNAVVFAFIFVIICMSGKFEALNNTLQLVNFSDEFRNILISTSVLDILGSFIVEKISVFLFSDAKVKPELFPRGR